MTAVRHAPAGRILISSPGTVQCVFRMSASNIHGDGGGHEPLLQDMARSLAQSTLRDLNQTRVDTWVWNRSLQQHWQGGQEICCGAHARRPPRSRTQQWCDTAVEMM